MRKVLLSAFLVLVASIALVISKTPEWFFLTSGKEHIDFTSETGDFNDNNSYGVYDGKFVVVPPVKNSPVNIASVLGASTNGDKRIEIDLTNQRLYAYEGNTKVYDFLVSTGKWGKTPVGTFHIWTKLRYVRMTGGNIAIGTYYDLPNVPYTMFFTNDADVPRWKGFGIHGTYWHHNFGHPMSHGCINMNTEEAAQLYYWANPDLRGQQSITETADNSGTIVVIYGTAPND